jgi:hypothetical protein
LGHLIVVVARWLAVAHEVVGQARNEDERWKAFLQLHAALQELKRRQQKKKKGTRNAPPPSALPFRFNYLFSSRQI